MIAFLHVPILHVSWDQQILTLLWSQSCFNIHVKNAQIPMSSGSSLLSKKCDRQFISIYVLSTLLSPTDAALLLILFLRVLLTA